MTKKTSSRSAADELAAAQKKIAKLEARETAHEHSAKVQSALYRIAETASAAQDMPAFYAQIHEIVGELMYADNFYIALYDEDRQLINFPFYRDEVDPLVPDPNAWDPFGVGEARGATAYVLRHGKPKLLNTADYEALVKKGEFEIIGKLAIEWMGAPLKADGRTVGVIAVQTYREDRRYAREDLDLLVFVAQHVGSALVRARAIEETRQRNAELAIVNEIGAALAKQLDFQEIVELVGARVSGIFEASSLFVALYDEATETISFPYELAEGERIYTDPIRLGEGLTSRVIQSRSPLRMGTQADMLAAQAIQVGNLDTESWLGVPIIAGDRVIGVIALETPKPNLYTESDERLLSTVASSMGVALENARLFDETKRLLAETDERAAELAIITSVQEGLAQNLDMQSMYDLVGDKIQEIFDAQVVDIGILDREADKILFPYTIERGVRFPNDSMPIIGPRRAVLETREPLVFNEDVLNAIQQYGQQGVISGETPKSCVYAPLVAGGEARGVISLQNLDRENAFSDSDVRLLMTLAGSLSVALENARLFDETKRLLAETDERAAELALINSVQEGLAQNLDMQAMYDLVGDRIQEIFDAQVVDIGMFDFEAGLVHYPYTIERGVRFPDISTPLEEAQLSQVLLETRQPLLVNDIPRWEARTRGGADSHPGRTVPLGPARAAQHRRSAARPDITAEPRPHERVLRDRRAPAHDAGRESQRGARERAPLR